MEQGYPLLIHIFRNKNRYLVCPYLDCKGGARYCSPWFKTVKIENADSELGKTIIEAIKVIKESPLLDVRKTENELGQFSFWKKENKSYSAFINTNFQVWLYLHEDGHYDICAPKRLDKYGYGGTLKSCKCGLGTSVEEIVSAVNDLLDFEEITYGKKKIDLYPPIEIELLCGETVTVYPPRDRHFTDMGDGSAAEIYRLYEYYPKEGAEPSAEFYLGIAAELDCDMSVENIRRAWEKQYGKAEFFEVKPIEYGIFKLRAEMRNKSVHRISYILEIADCELLDCTMELRKPNSRKKLDEKLSGLFEEFARGCKFKN